MFPERTILANSHAFSDNASLLQSVQVNYIAFNFKRFRSGELCSYSTYENKTEFCRRIFKWHLTAFETRTTYTTTST